MATSLCSEPKDPKQVIIDNRNFKCDVWIAHLQRIP